MFSILPKTLSMPGKTYEGYSSDSDDIHIMMDIYGVENLIGPGSARQRNSICCEIRFTDENEFCRAYGILTQESKKPFTGRAVSLGG